MFYTTAELLKLPNATWLIKGILPETGLSLLYGPPGEGKSFVAIDWSLSISTGLPWLGQYATRKGHVVYIAAEGGKGIKKRVAAWMAYHDVELLDDITWYLDALDIREEGTVDGFMEELTGRFSPKWVMGWDGEPVETTVNVKLVVLDTLSRNFGGEDENASTSMAGFVAQLEEFSKAHGATVLIVHHTNAAGTRERGHSSLKGAMESSFYCHAEKVDGLLDTITLENNKQKDDRDEPELFLKPVFMALPMLPRDEEGEWLTSLALKRGGQSEALIEALDAIVALLDQEGELSIGKIEGACAARDIRRDTVRKALAYGEKHKVLARALGLNNSTLFKIFGAKAKSYAASIRG